MTSTTTAPENADQARSWNEAVGLKWTRHQQKLDRLMSEVRDALLARAAARPGERVLDVGCGSGETTMAFARAVGPDGTATGADISDTLLALARQRSKEMGADTGHVSFLNADVQIYPFADASFDLVASRFGVMFFADPRAAFANLTRATRPGGRIHFAAWAPPADNPWFSQAAAAAVAQLGQPAPDVPGAPGPFAFADSARVLGLLSDAGFVKPAVETVALGLLVDGTPADVAALCFEIGPVTRIMTECGGTAADAAAIASVLTKFFGTFVTTTGMRVPALVHMFSAVKP